MERRQREPYKLTVPRQRPAANTEPSLLADTHNRSSGQTSSPLSTEPIGRPTFDPSSRTVSLPVRNTSLDYYFNEQLPFREQIEETAHARGQAVISPTRPDPQHSNLNTVTRVVASLYQDPPDFENQGSTSNTLPSRGPGSLAPTPDSNPETPIAVPRAKSPTLRKSLGSRSVSCRHDMASGFTQMSGDARRHWSSSSGNRYENRPPVSRSTPCKNGPLCRKFQEGIGCFITSAESGGLSESGTCPFNHDFSSLSTNGLNVPKKSFNVESPSFTPKTPNAQPAGLQSPRSMGISPKAAAAAAFTPRGSGSATPASASHSKVPSTEFVPQQAFQVQPFQEFVPREFIPQQPEQQSQLSGAINAYADPFLSTQTLSGMDNSQQPLNPYADQTPTVGGPAFFQDAGSYRHPLNYHLYASLGPRRDQLAPYQRATADFFIPDDMREDLQRKAEATLQTFANSTLPQNVDNHYHSLVALDSTSQRTSTTFGYPSWIYKATSSIDGNVYALRRIEGFRLTSDYAINTKLAWKKVNSGNIVRAHDAFTTQAFGDRSLIVVTDYHPLSQTLAEKHFGRLTTAAKIVPEQELWGYVVQLANAIRSIHANGLAARALVPSKVLMTSKNRLRLNGCAVLDIVQFEQQKSLQELQQADLQELGRLILDIATRNAAAHNNPAKALELVSRSYTDRLRACLQWLLSPPPPPSEATSPQSPAADEPQASDYNISTFLANIADQVLNTFDSTLSHSDELSNQMVKELENGRLVRLLAKLNVVLERPDPSTQSTSGSSTAQPPSSINQPSNAWSETGERYYLKLFRDYVFHQVDHDGRPVLDFGHVITCLNKLDAGIDERVQLVSRDEQNVFVVSFRELKRGFEAAWGEISRSSHSNSRR